MTKLKKWPKDTNWQGVFSPVPSGSEADVLITLAQQLYKQHFSCLLSVVQNDRAMIEIAQRIEFFNPEIAVITLSAWDCLPYDRVGPNGQLVGRKLAALNDLMKWHEGAQKCRQNNVAAEQFQLRPLIVLTTPAFLTQKIVPRGFLTHNKLHIKKGNHLELEAFNRQLVDFGYLPTSTVRARGEVALRGGLLDVFASSSEMPIRFDFFGDEVEQIHHFNAEDQRRTEALEEVEILPAREFILDDAASARFRRLYRKSFGINAVTDPLYESVANQMYYRGLEHWLGFLHERLEDLSHYLGKDCGICLLDGVEDALEARRSSIKEYYQARLTALNVEEKVQRKNKNNKNPMEQLELYRPAPIDSMYIFDNDCHALLGGTRALYRAIANRIPPSNEVFDLGLSRSPDFSSARNNPDADLVKTLIARFDASAAKYKLFFVSSESALHRLSDLLIRHGKQVVALSNGMSLAKKVNDQVVGISVVPLDQGFESDQMLVISEADVFGLRAFTARKRTRKKAMDYIQELSSLMSGDLVVHEEHGIARFDCLKTLQVDGIGHDCLRLLYDGGDRLYLPVENLDLLTRFGGDVGNVKLDRLGGASWQARKAKIKGKLKDIADQLIALAAKRAILDALPVEILQNEYEEFASRFEFEETPDQINAIQDIMEDMSSSKVMDRLVCGDVGFGKTEVALRAAFMVAMTGHQICLIAPTTLLAHQHFKIFKDRFKGWPINVSELSRFVPVAKQKNVKQSLKDGTCHIVIGTHSLLSKTVAFDKLSLLIIDEEQRFGVEQKEKLKNLGNNVHVLTLSATPIPRTLQMALSGVKSLSILSSPPIDRLSVRTFVMPFDGMVIKDAITRERFRGGQIFYVCPRVSDLTRIEERVRALVPDLKIVKAHGQLTGVELEHVMEVFINGEADMLLSTNIVESGLDVSNANTMIVHRSDMFGLAQLHQLRGRIGRSKVRAYCYFTLPFGRSIGVNAKRRLEAIQNLDELGAGFTLASQDMDIRGAGNLLGDEQSGHVREVGAELYLRMLEDAIEESHALKNRAKADKVAHSKQDNWSPQLNLGVSVMIPDTYIADLNLRLSLYRRLSLLRDKNELDDFANEMIDRFGALPSEVLQLIRVVEIRNICREAGIAKLDIGKKGVVIRFHKNLFANPEGLIAFLHEQNGRASLRPDHSLAIVQHWSSLEQRLNGITQLAQTLQRIVHEVSESGISY